MNTIISLFTHLTPVKSYAYVMIIIALIIRYFIGSWRYKRAGQYYGYNRYLIYAFIDFMFRWLANFLIASAVFLFLIECFNQLVTV